MDGDTVTNDQGNTVGDVVSTGGDDPKSCAITVLFAQNADFGDWVCKIEHSGSSQFQESTLVVRNEERVEEGIRLSGDLIPSRYVVNLIPYIEEGNFTIEGKVQINLVPTQV